MSRSTVINDISNSITGAFALHDLLSITTISGSIDITIVPQPALSSKAPAELRLNTTSGSIRVRMAPFLHDPRTVTPNRIFDSSIKSCSGNITAALVHNYKTSLSTMSGMIDVSLYPLSQPGSMSHVDLMCISGSTSMVLNPYVNDPKASIRALSINYRGSSGRLKVQFPSTWEGEVISHLNKDRVRHNWDGLHVKNDNSRFAAIKGNGPGKLNIFGHSLNVELVGERMPSLPRETEVKEEGERVPALAKEMEVKEEGERVPVVHGMPGLRREVDVQEQGGSMPDSPKEAEWQEAEGDDDDWTIVGDEDGAQEVTKRPPPTYEDAMKD